jgi:hypothetical protein
MQAMQHSPYAPRRLAASMRENAIVGFPEFVFVEPAPDCVLFDVQYELRGVFLELHDFGFDDRGNAVTAGAYVSNRSRRRCLPK